MNITFEKYVGCSWMGDPRDIKVRSTGPIGQMVIKRFLNESLQCGNINGTLKFFWRVCECWSETIQNLRKSPKPLFKMEPLLDYSTLSCLLKICSLSRGSAVADLIEHVFTLFNALSLTWPAMYRDVGNTDQKKKDSLAPPYRLVSLTVFPFVIWRLLKSNASSGQVNSWIDRYQESLDLWKAELLKHGSDKRFDYDFDSVFVQFTLDGVERSMASIRQVIGRGIDQDSIDLDNRIFMMSNVLIEKDQIENKFYAQLKSLFDKDMTIPSEEAVDEYRSDKLINEIQSLNLDEISVKGTKIADHLLKQWTTGQNSPGVKLGLSSNAIDESIKELITLHEQMQVEKMDKKNKFEWTEASLDVMPADVKQTDRKCLLELGAGVGEFAASIMTQLKKHSFIINELRSDRCSEIARNIELSLMSHDTKISPERVSIIGGPAATVLKSLEPGSIDVVVCLFPEPPNEEGDPHLLEDITLDNLAAVTQDEGLFFLTSDHRPLMERLSRTLKKSQKWEWFEPEENYSFEEVKGEEGWTLTTRLPSSKNKMVRKILKSSEMTYFNRYWNARDKAQRFYIILKRC